MAGIIYPGAGRCEARGTMVSFLFWNLGKGPLQERVARLAREHSVDVLILAECTIPPPTLLAELNRDGPAYHWPPGESTKVQIFTRLPPRSVVPLFDDAGGRVTVRGLYPGTASEVLLVGVHFHSRRDWTEDDQMVETIDLARVVAAREDERRHRRTVLVGDLNMNPFDKPVVAAGGLHAVMSRDIARGGERTVASTPYRFFYNPMWGFFGDRTAGPPGSHYFRGKHVSYFWHIYDQVLVRPELMDSLEDLRILTAEGATSLLSRGGLPDRGVGSDHLPLFFRLAL